MLAVAIKTLPIYKNERMTIKATNSKIKLTSTLNNETFVDMFRGLTIEVSLVNTTLAQPTFAQL